MSDVKPQPFTSGVHKPRKGPWPRQRSSWEGRNVWRLLFKFNFMQVILELDWRL